jgi:hypothetical protein
MDSSNSQQQSSENECMQIQKQRENNIETKSLQEQKKLFDDTTDIHLNITT